MTQLLTILRRLTCSTLMNLNAAAKNLIRLSRAQRKANIPLKEEGWECEMEKKDQFAMRPWGLRSRFNFILALFLALIIILAIFVTTKDGSWPDSLKPVFKSSAENCDLFSGRWVYDNSTYPLYSEKGCKFMSDQSACEKFGRTNLKHQNWRWQPHGCNLPRFNATRLLERLRDKRMAFVGDSLNRNQWISMICLLGATIPDPSKTMETNGFRMSFRVKEFNATVDFYWTPLLVESNSDDPVHHRIPDRIVRAQSIEKHARHWTDADILVFNSYLWWRRDTMKVLWGSFEDQDGIYKEIEARRAYELVLKTWSEWLEFHVDQRRTQMFFMSMSPTHFWGEEWGIPSEQNCYNETEPITKDGHRGNGSDADMMRIVEETIRGLGDRGVSVQILNITQLSEYRKDGHPSIYRKQWEPLTKEQLENPSSFADCIHWCLPGVPDVWNELLYAYIFSK
ncbi:protein trichome birefringence-like 34 [Elaeis guineensis]|uniref:Protein trichome birefringence-like 34 n=1 Tax=Elaeis guineensis var. tenera TaxID=51953 RepID=A0A6I9R965_ELAGV|nr:protein trichome birefringence-like 34 [Elaeis guineensis]